jgi:hypothetical protein
MLVKDVAQGVPVFKTFEINDVTDKSTDGAMRLEFTISNEDTDRDGDTIDAKGWTLQNFQKNPVVMFAHDYTRLPSGRALKTWAAGAHLKSLVEFTPDELYDENYHGIRGSTVFRFYKAGFLNAVSAGFYPVAWEPMQGKGAIGTHFTSQDLIEFSFVPVPSNPNALVARDGFSNTEIKSMKKELKRWVKDAEALCKCPTEKALGVSEDATGGALVPERGEKPENQGDNNMKPEEGTPLSSIEKDITDSDKSALTAAIGKENLQDLSAYHRRLHTFAAKGNTLTGFSNADMDWLHAQVEGAMGKLHKADAPPTEAPEPSPLEWKAVKPPTGDKKPPEAPEESPEEEAGEKPADEEEEEEEETEGDDKPKDEKEKCSHISEATGAIAARENGKKAKAEGSTDDAKNKEVKDVTPPTEEKAVEDDAVTKIGAKLSQATAGKLNEALGHFSEGFGHHDKAFNFQSKLSKAQENAAAEHDEAMKCYQKGMAALNVINGEKPSEPAEGSPAEEAAETPAEEAAEIAANPKLKSDSEKLNDVDEADEKMLSVDQKEFVATLKEFVSGLKKDLNL